MKPENRALIKALMDNSESLQEDIFADFELMVGVVPFILKVMARRPEFLIFSGLKDSSALRPRNLDARTAELLAIAAAAGAGADKCLKVHMTAAQRAGATEDEILDALFIAATIGQTKILASTMRTFLEFEEGQKKKQ